MENNRRSTINFRQYLILAINEVAGASLKPDNSKDKCDCDLLFASDFAQVDRNVNEIFKNKLDNYLQLVRSRNSVLQGELIWTDLEKIRIDAAVDLCNSMDDLWRSFIS